MTVMCGDGARTLDMSELLEHIRTTRPEDPHPLFVMMIVVGALLVSCALWGLLMVMIAITWVGA